MLLLVFFDFSKKAILFSSYLQETISAFKVRKEVTKAQNKSEAIDDARKYESKARKCRRKYDEQGKGSIITLSDFSFQKFKYSIYQS